MSDLLLYITFFPAVCGLLLLMISSERPRLIKIVGLAASGVTLILSGILYFAFDGARSDVQFSRSIMWIPSLNSSLSVGVDGLSLLLVVLTAFITPIALLSAWHSVSERVKEFTFMMLFLETGMLGVFCATDLLLFYVFWEAMLIPMYFIIGVWGGANRVYAAVKFFLYTMFGSLLMLVAILWLGYYSSTVPGGSFTTDLAKLLQVGPMIPFTIQCWMFLAFALSFAIKVPLFPLHTWLPDAHVEAPTSGSVILAAVLLKMGTYGFLRFCLPLFPQAAMEFIPYIALLAVIGVVYGALVSMVQTDMKKLVAYSSVSHLGFVVLGICALTVEAIQGSIIQMINHGLSTGALFLLVGMIYDRRHTRLIADYGGLAKVMPVFSTILLIVSLSSIGLPGLNGFVGEFLILLGAYNSIVISPWFSVVAATGVIFAAVYLLWMYQRVVFGKIEKPANQSLLDLTPRELVVLVPILIFIVWLGVYPGPVLDKSSATTQKIINTVLQSPTHTATPAAK